MPILYLLGLAVLVPLAYKAGQNKSRREGSSVEGELLARVPAVCLSFPTSEGLRMVGPHDREWCAALAYHLQLAAKCRALGISWRTTAKSGRSPAAHFSAERRSTTCRSGTR